MHLSVVDRLQHMYKYQELLDFTYLYPLDVIPTCSQTFVEVNIDNGQPLSP